MTTAMLMMMTTRQWSNRNIMRILFMGTSEFAVPSLHALIEKQYEIVSVVTQPDRPHGRGGRLSISPMKAAAVALNLPVLQPLKVRHAEFVEAVVQLNPDVSVVAAFGQLIPQRLLDVPRLGSINVHGSLLPRWRGAAPMQYSLISGDPTTGVTTMQMDAGLDTGDILLKAETALEDEDNLSSVESKLSLIGADLLIQTLEKLQQGVCPRVAQDEAFVTYAPSLASDFGKLDWNSDALALHNITRGVTPKPGAYTMWTGKRLKIWQTKVVETTDPGTHPPGTVETVTSQGITIVTGNKSLLLIRVQPEGKAQMPAEAWARGARLAAGSHIGE